MKLSFAAAIVTLFVGPAIGQTTANDESNRKYGVDDIIVSDEEQAEDQQYGGFPNNRLFNNDTECSVALSIIDATGWQDHDAHDDPRIKAFLRFSRVSLMQFDLINKVLYHAEPLVDHMEHESWIVLPILVIHYCRKYPGELMMNAISGTYNAARSTTLRD
jgi:hypothetical protein